MPLTTKSPSEVKSKSTPSKVTKQVNKTLAKKSRPTLSELSMNVRNEKDEPKNLMNNSYGKIDGEITFRYTPELDHQLRKSKINAKDHINNNLTDALPQLEIVGWSINGFLKSAFYDNLFTQDLKAKKLFLRGRGEWKTCHCPEGNHKSGQLIDTIKPERTTNLEQIIIFRTFKIASCALLDLISRSPNLKVVRFYGTILDNEHYDPFLSVRFLSDLNAVYWPWCNARLHKPTLRTIIKRNNQIQTLYTSSDVACDFINSDLLPNLKNLSLIMNDKWTPEPGKTKVLKRYTRNINALRRATNIEALEIRTFDVNYQITMDTEGDPEVHDLVRNNFETYKLNFWENVRDLPKLKFLAIYGAWELEEVTREMAKHGLRIEYFRTNLMPNSIISNLDQAHDNTSKFLVLSTSDAAKHLAKLANLKSLHFTCHDNLSNIDEQTASAMIELSDLIWKFEVRSVFTPEVEKLLTNILRRGNQSGRSYIIRLLIQPEDMSYANIYAEAPVKFHQEFKLRDMLKRFCQLQINQRFGKTAFKTYSIWGIKQSDRCREKGTFDQLNSTWTYYEQLFRPVDMFI